MDYEKEYKRLVARIKTAHQFAQTDSTKSVLEVILPQLRESEDERIRKEIIEYLTVTRERDLVGHPERQRWITYLEKQKERKPETLNEPYNPGEYEVVMEGNATSLKRKEQKPRDYCSLRDEFDLNGNLKQKPAEWNEEDEDIRDTIIRDLKHLGGDIANVKPAYKTEVDWLKALPERFNLQPKQEWNEKDKKILQSLHHVMNCADAQNAVKRDGLRVEDVFTFLFSIEPSWKPSEEQMDALKELIDDANRAGWVTPGATELYEQLKKL